MPKQRFAWKPTPPEAWVGMGLAVACWLAGWAVARGLGQPITERHARRIAQRYATEPLRGVTGVQVAESDLTLWTFTTECARGGTIAYRVCSELHSFDGYDRTDLPPEGRAVSGEEARAIAVAEAERLWGRKAGQLPWGYRHDRHGWSATTVEAVRRAVAENSRWRQPWSDPPFLIVRMRDDGTLTHYSHDGGMGSVRWLDLSYVGLMVGTLVALAGAIRTAIVRRRKLSAEATNPTSTAP